MKNIVKILPSTLLLGLGACSTAQQEEKPMNILYIMSDDHAFNAISAYCKDFVDTPNIDRLANEGMLFSKGYVANSISGPSRACLLTGKHSHTNGFKTNSNEVFDGSQQTFPKLLQQAGYKTAIIGKWHLNSDPTGFDYSDILIGQGIYYNAPFIENGEKKPSEGYATDVTGKKGIEWMKQNENNPFCLLLHHKAPHRTWMPDLQDLDLYKDKFFALPDNFYDKYEKRRAAEVQTMSIDKDMCVIYDLKMNDKEQEIKSGNLTNAGRNMYNSMTPEQKAEWDAHYDKVIAEFKKAKLTGKELAEWKYQQYMRDYMRTIVALDRSIGEVLDYLDESGLAENTAVVYTSDQGFYLGEHGWFDKRFMYEESFRTPLLVRLPGGKHGVCDDLVQNIDYAPTILDIAGVAIPEDIQGESFLPLLKGEKPADWRTSLYYHYYEHPSEHTVMRHYGVTDGRYKLIHFYNDENFWEVYDLQSDPSEMDNLYGTEKGKEIEAKLMPELIKLQKQYDDQLGLELNAKK